MQNAKMQLQRSDISHVPQPVSAYCMAHLSALARRSGETYAMHCQEVASVLGEAMGDPALLSVAMLHDLPVHPDGKELLSRAPIGDRERQLIAQMHSLRRLHIDESTRDLDTVIDAFLEQPELLPLRMAHRVNDVRHLDRFTGTIRRQIAFETLHMYAAIAGRLGMQKWRIEMEDICFPVLQPTIVAKLRKQYSDTSSLDNTCLEHTCRYLTRGLKTQGIDAELSPRMKGLYSTYRKMILKDRAFHELTDRLAVRIIVPRVEDCYLALGVVHAIMRPMPGKLKDYIGAPKENGYRSIHSVVYPLPGVTDLPIEIQIRTAEMQKDCEYGPAAHGEYKQTMYALGSKPARVNLFRNLQSLRAEASTPQQFEDALRMYFREDHVAIFDHDNNLYHFKKPVSAMDFVCLVYPKQLLRLKEVCINGRRRPIGTQLQDGDTVEARFAREKLGRKEWLDACLHKSTRQKLRDEIRKE